MNWRWSLVTLAAVGLVPSLGRADDVTYCKDVAPILNQHCAACHRPGEIGPFSLLTYKDAAKRATFSRTSPPASGCRRGSRSPATASSTMLASSATPS